VFKSATSETRASEEGFVTDELLAFYEPLALARTPLMITGNLYYDPSGRSTHRQCGADADDKIPGLRRWAELARVHGSKLFAQLNHCGRQVLPRGMGLERAVSASAVSEKIMGTKPRPLRSAEIRSLVAAHAAAAGRCQEAGFDGVQIHAAHGYLVNQFLTPYTNRRTDAYGRDAGGRLRFLLEVYRATRARVGPGFPLIAKINGSDWLPGRRGLGTEELVAVARALEGEGIDGFEVSVGHYESGFPMIRGTFGGFLDGMLREGLGSELPRSRRWGIRASRPLLAFAFDRLWPHREGFNLGYTARFKAALSVPVLCVGGFRTRRAMASAIRDGACDAVSCARAMIADPFLYQHLLAGEPGPRCDVCNACIARAGRLPVDCYHPAVGRAKARMLEEREALAGSGAAAP
jgi:2,4-dienoyl-CoA reductase-like NADH-dependent reductase (Old Yellow Enzyme family)